MKKKELTYFNIWTFINLELLQEKMILKLKVLHKF
jgi:hypothetical protein